MDLSLKELLVSGQTGKLAVGVNKSILDKMWGVEELGWHNDTSYFDNQLQITFDQDLNVIKISILLYSTPCIELINTFGDFTYFLSTNELYFMDLWSKNRKSFITLPTTFSRDGLKELVQMTNSQNVTVAIGYEPDESKSRPIPFLRQVIVDSGGMWEYSLSQIQKTR